MSVNMSTAYRMIKDYLPQPSSSSDTWIIQNGANSSVGQYVLQLCKAWNLGCIGLIRDRPNVEELKAYLTRLGSEDKTTILTYDELADRPKPSQSISLGLNCVSGNAETVGMMKWMSNGSRLITYGGMSMKPLVVPTSLLIFRDLKLEGFMLTNWRMKASKSEYREMLEDLVRLIDRGHLLEHEHATIVDLNSHLAEKTVRETVKQSMSGRAGRKFLFRFI
ncbi:mitochondrial 2-enoyl thioester reductase [Puccinia graminis f. sp. tritici]|uniref:Mitochondrial 2-enoyl thioester reductase n=2 Tax=Puccinia graminis f. sp. tritici TaxID=56615 RepID=A0A5B0R0S8_PUCGR|nr:mitochondrial 2-enoyl thioester reductase [Puccinia graminis f. sp. tritici]